VIIEASIFLTGFTGFTICTLDLCSKNPVHPVNPVKNVFAWSVEAIDRREPLDHAGTSPLSSSKR